MTKQKPNDSRKEKVFVIDDRPIDEMTFSEEAIKRFAEKLPPEERKRFLERELNKSKK